jgi:SAM-dependent methyltransferase
MGDASDHITANRDHWDSQLSAGFRSTARAQWTAEPHWGLWRIPQEDLPVLPGGLDGKDLVELGCGTAYICAWAARRGARPVGLDNSAEQLATARAMQDEFGLQFPLVHGPAETAPFSDASFDVAISEHGASAWADPYRWIPEAARLLRPGGELIFMRNSTLLTLCLPDDGPAGRALHRAQAGLFRLNEGGGATSFQLPTGPMIRLARDCGLRVEDIEEVFAPDSATSYFDYVDLEWAHSWPSEEVWRLRKV